MISHFLKSKTQVYLIHFFLGFVLIACEQQGESSSDQAVGGLYEIYSKYFPIGVSVSPKNLQNPKEANLIKNEFASLTAENVMKMAPIHPEQNRYNWAPADALVNFATSNDMKMRGHTLVWHNQHPSWFFIDTDSALVSKDTLYARMQQHILDVMTRYKGKIYAWDVVNEAVSDDTAYIYRQDSPFYKIAGKEYIEKAFRFAHEIDPNAQLFYNDYSAVNPNKAQRIYTMLKELLAKGVPIHGVGIQGHWSIFSPKREEIENAIALYSSLGLSIQVTELDISVYPPESGRRALKENESTEFTRELEQKQVAQYKMIFDVFRKHSEYITGVTFWNVSDRHSWLDNFPVRGRKNYPLLFNQNLDRKKAYKAIIDF